MEAHKLAKRPFFDDPMLEILRDRGLDHERAYTQHLIAKGKRIIEIRTSSTNAFKDTMTAMSEAADAIVQARLENGSWAGWSDVLILFVSMAKAVSANGDAAYEVTAMKRLMGRYGSRADELDQLSRAEVFVDLYSVVRKGLRAGVDSYSIKKLEPFYGPGTFRAARDLLLRMNPRLIPGNPLRKTGESTVASARRVVLALDHGVLAIQGPPGTGKTFAGARMIVNCSAVGTTWVAANSEA
jgi:hypothetical protein